MVPGEGAAMSSPRAKLPERRAAGICLPRPRNVRRERMCVPKERMCIPQERRNAPQERRNAPRRRRNIPARRMNVPEGRMKAPQGRTDAPRGRFHGKHRGKGRHRGCGMDAGRVWGRRKRDAPPFVDAEASAHTDWRVSTGRQRREGMFTLSGEIHPAAGVPPTWDRVCRRSAPWRSVETRQSICADGTVTTIGGASPLSARPPTPHTKIRGASASLASSVASVFPSVSRYRPCPRSIRQRFLPLRLAS